MWKEYGFEMRPDWILLLPLANYGGKLLTLSELSFLIDEKVVVRNKSESMSECENLGYRKW